MAKFLDDKLSLVLARGNSLIADLAQADLEHKADKRYKGLWLDLG